METRLICSEEVPTLAAMHADCFGVAGWSRTQIEQSLLLESTLGMTAVADNGALKSFILCQVTADEAEIMTFCTALSARREGYGTILLGATVAVLRENGVRRVFLEVAENNKAALSLYDNSGFTTVGRRRGYYRAGVDAIMMQCLL